LPIEEEETLVSELTYNFKTLKTKNLMMLYKSLTVREKNKIKKVQFYFLHTERFLKDRTKQDLRTLKFNKNNWKPNMVPLEIMSNIFAMLYNNRKNGKISVMTAYIKNLICIRGVAFRQTSLLPC
jgi:hypothetical protein